MLHWFRQLARPLTCLSMLAFAGQLLIVYCAGMNVATAAVANVPAVSVSMHHHDGNHAHTSGKVVIGKSCSMPCCCKHRDSTQAKERCCDVNNANHPVLPESSRQQLKNIFQHAGTVALLSNPFQELNCTAKPDIPPKPGFERTRIPPAPAYLTNCSFLE